MTGKEGGNQNGSFATHFRIVLRRIGDIIDRAAAG
jgi:hypothetical protein